MKVWQMLKELTEHPEKMFKRPEWRDGWYVYNNKERVFEMNSGIGFVFLLPELDDDGWQEVNDD